MQMIEQEEKGTTIITEEKKGNTGPELALSRDEEIRILKGSFLNLYRKFMAQSREVEELRKGLKKAESQNVKLKELNRVLLDREYSEGISEDSLPIF